MFCKNCGKEIADDSKFCSFCGINIENAAEEPDSEEEIAICEVCCPDCGSCNVKIEQRKFEENDGCVVLFLIVLSLLCPPLLLLPLLMIIYNCISPGKKVKVCQKCGKEWEAENFISERIPFWYIVCWIVVAIIVLFTISLICVIVF